MDVMAREPVSARYILQNQKSEGTQARLGVAEVFLAKPKTDLGDNVSTGSLAAGSTCFKHS